MSTDSDNTDRATELAELWNQSRIQHALHGASMNPCLGAKTCIQCGEPNDRDRRAAGFDVRHDCATDPGWHLREDGV